MEFNFKAINETFANQVVNWEYEGDYIIFDEDKEEMSLETLMTRDNSHCFVAVDASNHPSGFLGCTLEAEELSFVCFLNPDLTSKGRGADFVNSCVDFMIEYFDYTGEKIFIIIESYNKHAIKLFKRLGFIIDEDGDDWVEMALYL